MKIVKSYEEFLTTDLCAHCKVHLPGGGVYEVTCDKCSVTKTKKESKKEVRKDTIDEIDTNGNGRLTKKEIKDWIDKDK